MSLDDRVVLDTIAVARRRAIFLAAAEAAAWGAIVAAASPTAGLLTALAVAVWRSRAVGRAAVVRVLERSHPGARNLPITAEELSSGRLAAGPDVSARVFADAAVFARQITAARAYPIAPLVRASVLAGVAWVLVVALGPGALVNRLGFAAASRAVPRRPSPVEPGRVKLTTTVQPPSYTGLAPATFVDPPQVQAVEGSALTLAIAGDAGRVTVDQDGVAHQATQQPDGTFVDRLTLARTGFILVTSDTGARRLIPVIVSPDTLPAVTMTTPGRDLRYAAANAAVAFDARASDDFGLKSLALRFTKVSGSGEQFEFQEGEIPLQVTQASPREWSGRAIRSLANLDLKEGDMLVYRAVATDARPGDGSASSDAFFIEITRLGAAAGDAFTLPEEETRYALSQQMLIQKTERLHRSRAALAARDVIEASQNLAVEQRMIRAEFVFMLGGEVEDEDVEAARSNELQEGRLLNRGQRDLRAATIAMSQAEKLLTSANTADALTAERAAVAALQRAFSKDRYILRALGARSQLDQSRRLTGDLAQAGDWRRIAPAPADNRRAAQLQDVLRGIAELIASGDGSSVASRSMVIAEQALRIDPASASLRQIATDLQRAAGADGDGRASALASASAAAAAEARRSLAGGTLAPPTIAPALSGAFTDALPSAVSGFSRTPVKR